jgi:hypothetical protein
LFHSLTSLSCITIIGTKLRGSYAKGMSSMTVDTKEKIKVLLHVFLELVSSYLLRPELAGPILL